ncbi:hypothetical protein TruAng_010490 [Truncatella angustata]|nr:hypothetical protein TruAng_010490 [Truncatella angustata]
MRNETDSPEKSRDGSPLNHDDPRMSLTVGDFITSVINLSIYLAHRSGKPRPDQMASQERPEWWKPSLYPTVDISPKNEDTALSKVVHLQPPSPRAPGILTIASCHVSGLRFPDHVRGSGYTGSGAAIVQNKWQVYAILEYEAFQERIEDFNWDISGRVRWSRVHGPLKFDIYRPSQLNVHLLVRSSSCSGLKEELQVIPLGLIKYDPFQEAGSPDRGRRNIQDSTVKIRINVSYIEKKGPDPDVWQNWTQEWSVLKNASYAYIICKRGNGNRKYAMRTLPLVVLDADADITQNIRSKIQQHPFIAPLQFVFESPQGLSLLSPVPSSGHLFYYLQKERRFELDEVMFYAAELVCVLEHLHGLGIIASLKLENILLDSFGHISLCSPNIFGLASNDKNCLLLGTEYPAPELLTGGEISEKVDWWGFGIVLYEMMVGLPPFQHKNAGEQRQKTLSQALQIPKGFPPAANDILHSLLQKSPANRLGANGASELKTHAFFQGINWQELLQRKQMSPLMPVNISTSFVPNPKAPKQRSTPFVVNGVDIRNKFNAITVESHKGEENRVNIYDDVALDAYKHGWELVWDQNIRQFHFKNRLTDEKRPVGPQGSYTTVEAEKAPRTASVSKSNPTVPEDNDEAISRRPSVDQKRDALAAALKAGYNSRVVSRILTYDIDLNIAILKYDHKPDSIIDAIPVTPLE